ncbi:ankyrin repeat domain-containing protein 13C-like [Saccoglossus kowalevskii]|uniref:Ankyrin repeat domain-containing protein 13C-like n=1 Tax=Saccoglossus kowalevskii TaxID=10224 RepID=A0ABM0GZR0_SACKO|nr:PREDICTED: ankyrin repeat domain-containing protein 13C-like [Saccoglossus kowalevskii]
MANTSRFPLHESVFNGNLRQVSALLRSHDVTEKDIHGNTPLHLAVILGHKECVHLLLAHGAPVKVKNAQGWTPLAEAISYGERQTITSLLRKLKQQSRESLEDKRPQLIQALRDLGDFYLELKWDFQSWVPLVSRMLPSDICKVHKKGSCIRVDSTLVDFNDMKWQRGDLTFIFNGDARQSKSLVVIDNELKVYQWIRPDDNESEIEDEVDILMSSDIVTATMSTKPITFTRAQSGWLFREDKSEMVGPFSADFYIVNGMMIESRKRREHLTDEDVQKNKAVMDSFSKGTVVEGSIESHRRTSLPPPVQNGVSWENYINAPPKHPPVLGRQILYKESRKGVKATVAMSDEFPLTVEELLNVLEVITPFKHFNKLREFVEMKLPTGFPVKIDIPVLPTITARITFQEFQNDFEIPSSLFYTPRNYKEDPNRFPDL